MKRFFIRVGRFFWSWGFLKFVLFAITLTILLYAEEDWRGARAWAATKAKWEARGVSFDPDSFIPTPVPDAENLGALPIFDPAPDSKTQNSLTPAALGRALHEDSSDRPPYAPSLTYNWQQGGQPDMDKLRRDTEAFYNKVFSARPATNDALAQWEAIYPFIVEVNAAAEIRTRFRLQRDYTPQPAFELSFSPLTSLIKVAKVLSVHAVLSLNENRPELAMADVKTMLEISQGVGREPSLVAGLVSGGLCSITAIVISHGLSVRGWDDSQLAEIQAALDGSDMLSTGQGALRSECVVESLPMLELLKLRKNRPAVLSDGWIDQNLSQTANHLLSAAALIDPSSHRVDVDAMKKMNLEANRQSKGWMRFAPWNIMFEVAAGPITNAQRQFARIQTYIDEGRIACGLERYRLAHGNYPGSLDALVPAYIDRLPCDPIDGQEYRYRAKPDGTYLLYSIGWNQKDDGGAVVLTLRPGADPGDSPSNYGDWVWPTPKR